MLSALTKFLRRLLLVLATLFVGVNVLAWVALNTPPVQAAVLTWVNKEVFAGRGYELTIQSLSLKILTSAIVLEGVELRAPAVPGKGAAAQEDPSPAPRLSAEKLEVRIDPLSSWLRKAVVVRSLRVDGLAAALSYDSGGNLVLPESSGTREERTEDLVRRMRMLLPSEIAFARSVVTLGAENGPRYQRLNISELSVSNLKNDIDVVPLSVRVVLGESVLRAPELPTPIAIQSLEVGAQVGNDLAIRIENLGARSSLGSARARGSIRLPVDGHALDYALTFESDANLGALLALFELKASGLIHVEGALRKDPKDDVVPRVEASARWVDAVVDGIAIYSGSVRAKIVNRRLDYFDAVVNTPSGARIDASGTFELRESFAFVNHAHVRALPFTELLAGFGLKTQAMEFLLNTPGTAIEISGTALRPGGRAERQIDLKGAVGITEMRVPSIHTPSRSALPSCQLNLRLAVYARQIDFRETSLSCRPDSSDLIAVDTGNVRFADGRTDFHFHAKDVDLAWASDFTGGFPTEGRADLVGSVTASANQPVTFRARTIASDVLLYGVRYKAVEGEWGIDENGVFGEHMRGSLLAPEEEAAKQAGAKPETGTLELDSFRVGFDNNVTSLFKGRYVGSLRAVFQAIRTHLPERFPATEGDVGALAFSMEGPLLVPSKWTLHSDGSVARLETLGFRSEDTRLFLSCVAGVCKNSKLYAQKISALEADGVSRTKPGQSYLLVDVREISTGFVNARAVVRSLPLSLAFDERFPLRGVVNARADVIGPWKSWEGSLQVSADALRLGEKQLGALSLSGFSSGGKEINLVAFARYQQLSLRMRMPHSLSGASTLYLRTRGLDLGFLLAQGTVAKHNLYTQLDGEVLLSGPAPLTPEEGGARWYDRWEAQGSLSRALFQYRQLRFALEKKSPLSLRGRVLSVPGMRLGAEGGHVDLSGTYDFAQAEIDARLGARVNLGLLEGVFGKVGSANGTLVAEVELAGKAPELGVTGEARLEGGSVALKDFPPPFTDINGEFIFDDDKLEIRRLRAKKGDGEIEAAGSVNWRPWLNDASRYPIVALRLTARGAQARIPVPAVEFFDTTVDGTLELFGDELPYTLSGEVRIVRAATFRDKTCQDLIADEQSTRAEELRLGSQAFLRLDVQVVSDKGIVLQTSCVKSRLSANVKITGTSQEPVLSGVVDADNGQVSFLKSNFTVQRAEFTFDNPVRLDPRVDVQLVSHIDTFNVYVSVDGTLSRRRTNLWVDPPTTSDGATLTRSDIFRMLSTGQPPNLAGTQGQAIASQVAAYGTSVLALDDSLTQAANRLTGGFIDNVQLEPLIENGQTKWRARVSRSLGERLSLGLDIEQGQAVNNQSLNGTVFINDSVNLLGGFDRKSEQTEQYYELSGGLRFQFGSSR